jgi:RNA polymerase sigma factor (sigma-70 family)
MKNQYLQLTDQELIFLFCDGDSKAFAFLFNLWKIELYSYVLRYVKGKEEAEDILYDTFEKIVKTSCDYRNDKFITSGIDFKAFLKSVLKNRALDILKIKKNRFRIVGQLKYFFQKTTLNDAMISDEERLVSQILKPLPPREREIFTMHMQGFSIDEISKVFFLSKKTVSNIISNTKEQLRVIWKKNHPSF